MKVLATTTGVRLFCAQHQFEATFWEQNFVAQKFRVSAPNALGRAQKAAGFLEGGSRRIINQEPPLRQKLSKG
ncbi:MAG: hypothetical protein ACJAYN_003070 [Bermanella sp.]|jgi:hypothetical protein